MGFSFSDEDIERIADVLEVRPKIDDSLARFSLEHAESGRSLALEIKKSIELPASMNDQGGSSLISVYAASSFLQLQNCTGFIASKDLGEVIFFSKAGGATSGLVIEREAGCSLYSNVDDRLLSTDFTHLPPELVMSSVALSLTDKFFDNIG